jgi:hypothetical protein
MAKERISRVNKANEKPMTLEEAKAYRASLYVPRQIKLSDQQKREQFRIFWAQAKRKYGKTKDLEEILWLHLKASKMDEPDMFAKGLLHFGLKEIKGE